VCRVHSRGKRDLNLASRCFDYEQVWGKTDRGGHGPQWTPAVALTLAPMLSLHPAVSNVTDVTTLVAEQMTQADVRLAFVLDNALQ
jgi:hypothetical protein